RQLAPTDARDETLRQRCLREAFDRPDRADRTLEYRKGDGGMNFCKLFQDEQGVEVAQPMAAERRIDVDAKKPHFSVAPKIFPGERLVRRLHVAGRVPHLVPSEAPRQLLQLLLVGGEAEIHSWLPRP